MRSTLIVFLILFSGYAVGEQRQAVIEEIIVTANKRTESLQEISSAVTAISDELAQQGDIESFFDIADLTPGMIQQTDREITIRGLGRNGGDASFASTVAVHENGFFLPNGVQWPMVDIGAVEITRGPSGAVYGRNATGGAINSKWHTPEPDWGASVDLTVGDYGTRRGRGHINAPLLDDSRLLSRWAFVHAEHDGHMRNSLTPDHLDPENRDEWLWRVYLTSEPTDSLRIAARYMDWFSDNEYIYGSPDLETRRSGILESLGARPLPDDTYKVRANVLDKNGGRPGWSRIERGEIDLTWSIPIMPLLGNVDLDLLAGEQRHKARRITDLDATEIDIVFQNQEAAGYVRNAELRFSSNNSGGFNWMLGLFWSRFFDDEAPTQVRAIIPVKSSVLLPLPGIPDQDIIVRAEIEDPLRFRQGKSQALFANATVELETLFQGMPAVELFGGYRINDDDVAIARRRNQDVFIPSDAPAPAQSTSTLTKAADSFREPTWEFGGKWFINDSHMVYVKRAKGYKAGAVESTGGALNRVEPEILEAWEVGSKSAFFDRALTINLSAFHYDYDDLQVFFFENLESRTENAASATIKGIELEAQWRPTKALFTLLSASYLDAKFDEYCTTDPTFPQGFTDPACEGKGGERDLSGNRLANSPRLTLAAFIRYTLDFEEWGTVSPLIKSSYTEDIFTSPTNLQRYEIGAFSKTDVRLAWESQSEQYAAEFFVENIENHREIFLLPVAVGVENALFFFQQVPPRTTGLRVTVRF